MEWDLDGIKAELENYSKAEVVAFAYRCALRAAPVLGRKGHFKFWSKNDRKKYVFSVLRIYDILELILNSATADAAYAAADVDAAYAAAAAAADVDAAATAYAATAYAATAATAYAATAADRSVIAFRSTKLQPAIESEIQSDLTQLKSENALLHLPLWRTVPTAWSNMSQTFIKALTDIGFAYWAQAYSERIAGHSNLEHVKVRATLPQEILSQTPDAITQYLIKLAQEGARRFNEVKVIFLGDGGAGKTSLVRKVFDINAPLLEQEPATPGVDIHLWAHKDLEIKAHLWDFGGQVIMHATHQFFMTERSINVVVLDSRKEQDPDYWLQHTKVFGGDSPVLVVINKIDDHAGDLERNTLKDKYPAIQGFYPMSCKSNQGVADFIQALRDSLSKSASWNTDFPVSWFAVKEALQQRNDDFISIEQYRDICLEFNVDPATQDSLLTYLNDLGVMVYFKALSHFNTQVLNPRWLTQAVYQIINAPELKAGKGVIAFQQLHDILTNPTSDHYYPKEKYAFIMEMMQQFELCYRLQPEQSVTASEFLIPDLLDKDQPNPLNFAKANALRFRFTFEFLPRAIIARFIVKMAQDIKDQCRWRFGVVLKSQSTDGLALIIADQHQRSIDIWVKGHQSRQYFAIIRDCFYVIFNTYTHFDVTEKVPIDEARGVFELYTNLLGLERMGKTEYDCGALQQTFDLATILDGFETPAARREKAQQQQRAGAPVFAPVINVDARSTVQNQININIDIKNQSVMQFKGIFQVLKEDTLDELEDPTEREKLAKELTRVEGAIQDIAKAQDPQALAASPAMDRLRRWVEKLKKADTRIGQAIQKVEDGADLVNGLIAHYNKIAGWVGMLPIPKLPISGQ